MSGPRHLVEELVLALFERGDRGEDVLTMAGHCVGMRLGMAMLDVGTWRIRHERPDLPVTRFVGELGELGVDHTQVVAQGAQPIGVAPQLSLDRPLAHRRRV